MGEPFVILQLSDIHRTWDDPVSNATLLAALESDRLRWPSTASDGPDLVVISGDLIQGVSLGTAAAPAELDRQYDDAQALLLEICERFLQGHRDRLVLVPGNHDVDWVSARASMELASADELSKVADRLPSLTMDPESDYRWSWRERRLYKIVDKTRYASRLERFLTFRRSFYDGVSPDPLALDTDLLFMEFPDLDLTITGFSSWHGNDCFNYVGAFDAGHLLLARDAIARSDCGLHLAVWHHGVRGGPNDADYMDPKWVHRLVDHGFRIGLHGHHHRSAAAVMQVRLPSAEEFALLSTGSLAAGGRQLPAGVERQYSVICVDPDSRSVEAHVRESTEGLIFVPGTRPDFGGESSLKVQWSDPPLLPGRAAARFKKVDQAFSAHRSGKWQDAWDLLEGLPSLPQQARRLVMDTAAELGNWDQLIDLLGTPETQDELVALVDAHLRILDFPGASALVASRADDLGVSPSIQAELQARIAFKEGQA